MFIKNKLGKILTSGKRPHNILSMTGSKAESSRGSRKLFKFSKKQIMLFVSVVVAAVFLISAFYFYDKYNSVKKSSQSRTALSLKEESKIVERVERLVDLPAGEVPNVATVSDKAKLSKQPFFEKAENGDKVLIYGKIKKAILYRPKTGKVIEISTINFADKSSKKQNSSDSAALKFTKVTLLNGTSQVGLTKNAEERLKGDNVAIQILNRSNASITNYGKTLVVDLKNKHKEIAEKIAESLGGEVSPLPVGEAGGGADIIVILGSDFIK